MTDFMKKITAPMVLVGVGALNIIFMLFSFVEFFVKYSGDSLSEGYSAFKSMSLGDEAVAKGLEAMLGSKANATGIMNLVAVLLIVFLLFSIAMLVVGVLFLLRDYANVELGSLDLSKVEKLSAKAPLANFISTVAICVITGFSCLLNIYTASGSGVKASAGMRPGAGFYLLLILAIAVFVLTKKFGLGTAEATAMGGTTYKCAACGAKAKASDKFCPACGGNVVALATPIYKCSACGAKAKATDKFCAKCGAAVIATAPVTYKCSACGAKAKATDKFCSKCGAGVIAEEAKIEVEETQEA